MAMTTGVLPNTVYPGYAPAASITLTANASGGTAGYTYNWTGGITTATNTVSPAANTVYNVTVTDSKGCTASATKAINVVNITSTNAAGNVIICHKTSQETNTIAVDQNAVAAHLLHGDYLGTCNEPNQLTLLRITASPNPSRDYFVITVEGGNVGEKISVAISDAMGRVIEVKENIFTKSFRIGKNYIPGLYFIHAVQGSQLASLTLVKPK
jgi:hypothetical protein